ncbi:hypothetical protein BO83DRAFT_179586 [Aspergillus eucalypticola CBS 122712]|uniref:Uncharacterized protein n=1 Tax=Aspergillus eucalypticola (strain CBS 122712 / IBT 29274) TaxID=1448314 RepID=A0A317UN63_ASPEC|nr:uncharacterized protein BO83DRAFT_179586 [Aspergillus eucalypticola CBS 122712]PWY62935.1 hypothetical protein BO83DRAFT_179586 [Aspergillus eucalypticola CBS 122712]
MSEGFEGYELRRLTQIGQEVAKETTQGHQRPPPIERHDAVGDNLTGVLNSVSPANEPIPRRPAG